ncbi:MAG: hypothetical protein HFI39_07310 [Lachnospiraceae bacterium]|nr:hypothetical protein [Lachnospiraceae bacterium]
MQWCEPIYTGEKARKRLKDYRRLLGAISGAANKELGFYVLASPANGKNLLEILPAYYLKQASYRIDSLVVLGLAADRQEAFELCGRILRDCYLCHGCLRRELLFDSVMEK